MSGSRLSDYDYFLDPERIAQVPVPERDQSRLMVVNRETGDIRHARFIEIIGFLKPGDLLVLNDTRVVRARLKASKETGGQVEIFLLRDLGENRWEALVRGKVSEGTALLLENGPRGRVESRLPGGKRIVCFQGEQEMDRYMEEFGVTPLPPYIQRNGRGLLNEMDRERYQTVYSKSPGAVAAPTAGLHFTQELISRVQDAGVEIAMITLHVGYGTFKPVTVEDIRQHRMDRESYSMGSDAARAIASAVKQGRRVIAVGTTSTRALETAFDETGNAAKRSGDTDLFITPGYRFRAIQGLITNFHLPKSTLLMLVAAFMGKGLLDRAYEEAKEKGYRFYSYGDAMLII